MKLYRDFKTQEDLDLQYNLALSVSEIFPSKGKDSPVMVFIHGGYWVRCSSKDFSVVATGLVKREISVVVINYSLCPKVTISEITRQNRAVNRVLPPTAENRASRRIADSKRETSFFSNQGF